MVIKLYKILFLLQIKKNDLKEFIFDYKFWYNRDYPKFNDIIIITNNLGLVADFIIKLGINQFES